MPSIPLEESIPTENAVISKFFPLYRTVNFNNCNSSRMNIFGNYFYRVDFLFCVNGTYQRLTSLRLKKYKEKNKNYYLPVDLDSTTVFTSPIDYGYFKITKFSTTITHCQIFIVIYWYKLSLCIFINMTRINLSKQDVITFDKIIEYLKLLEINEPQKQIFFSDSVFLENLQTLQNILYNEVENTPEYRLEKDSLGEVKVPANRYWAAQTQRSIHHFSIGNNLMPLELVYSLALIKKCAAIVNSSHKKNSDDHSELLSRDKSKAIIQAADEIMSGRLDENFPLYVWQTGSGTQTNMNVNEVIANRAAEISNIKIHPNDDVNMSQSSNDVFPTAMHIAAILKIIGSPLMDFRQKFKTESYRDSIDGMFHNNKSLLLQSVTKLRDALYLKSIQYNEIIKVGRTHLQDAVPLTFGQEISGWVAQLDMCKNYIEQDLDGLFDLAIGGTAVGTGLDSYMGFGDEMAAQIEKETGLHFRSSKNKFASLASHDPIVHLSGALKTLACTLMKIANDVRWLASGPRCGIGEIRIPQKEPGSSIMPGKVNPTQCEAVTMVCCQVIGNDTTITMAGSQGNFELNAFKPVIIFNLLESIRVLSDVCDTFCDFCINDIEYQLGANSPNGIEPNIDRMNDLVCNSLMLVTALKSSIGYDKASKIAKKAYEEGKTLKQVTMELGYLSEEKFDRIINPKNMIKLKK